MRIYKTEMETMNEERIKLLDNEVIMLSSGDDSILIEEGDGWDYFESNGIKINVIDKKDLPSDCELVYSNIIYKKVRNVPKLEPLDYFEGKKLKKGIYFKDDQGEIYRIEKFSSDRIMFELEDGTKKKITFRRKND